MVSCSRGEFAFVASSAVRGDSIQLAPEEAHHAFRVRRMSAGDDLWVTDGAGMVYRCRVTPAHEVHVVERHPEFGEPKFPITLCVAVLKGDGNRDIVDIAVQLGAVNIIFFHADRSEGRLTDAKLERLTRTAVSAIKQTGRARLPRIELKEKLRDVLRDLPKDTLRLIAHPSERVAQRKNRSIETETVLLVGPEGGFTEEEVALAEQAVFRLLTLANRRLRSPLAVAAGLTFILSEMGECG